MVTIEKTDLATRNIHGHSFTCQKNQKKVIRIQPHEGHGKFKPPKGSGLLESPKCRFYFPRFPMLVSKILEPLSTEDHSEEEIEKATKDLKKIQKFMIRQTYSYKKGEVTEEGQRFLKLTFEEFLDHLDLTENEYEMALKPSIKGRAKLFLQRSPEQVFINKYNKKNHGNT